MGRAFTVKAVHKDMYPATYNFKDEADGTSGDDISGFHSFSTTDTNGAVTIIALEDGHRKVMKISGDGDNGTYTRIELGAESETSGSIELLVKYIDNGVGTFYLYFYNESSVLIGLSYISSGTNLISNQYGNGAGGNTTVNTALASDTWMHLRWSFDCATDKQSLWLDGILKIDDENFRSDATATSFLKQLFNNSEGVGANALEGYVDAIGYSWDTNYNVGDNIHWRNYKESTDSFEGDDVGTQGTTITWIDVVDTAASVEIVQEFNEHKKIIRQYYSSAVGGEDWSTHYFASQSKDGWFACWLKVSDITVDNYIILWDSVIGEIIHLGIGNSVFEYKANGGAWTTVPSSPTPVNDTWYLLYIQWYDAANDNFDLFINNIQYLDGVQTLANMGVGMDMVSLYGFSATEYMYIDAPISSLDSDERADNRILEYNDTYTKTDITSTVLNIPDYRNRIYEWRTGTLISNTSYEFSEIFVEIYDINSVLTMRAELKSRKQNDAEYRYSLRDILWDDLHEPITHTFTTDDIHDPADSTTLLLTALPNVGQEDGDLILVEGDTKTTTYSPVLKSYPTYMFLRDIADLADCSIIITPEGKVYMDDDKASGDSLDVDTATDKDKMTGLPVPTDILESINYFEIFGAWNPDTGARFYKVIDNSGTDKKRKWRYINNDFENQTDVDNYATALSTRVTTVKIIRAGVQSLGGHNMGETLNYKYIKGTISIAQANYYIIEERMNFDKNMGTLILSEGMIEGSKYSAGFERPQNYMDSFAGEIYETDINTIDLFLNLELSSYNTWGVLCAQNQAVIGMLYISEKVDISRDIIIKFVFTCATIGGTTIDGELTIDRYACDGSADKVNIENAINWDFTTTATWGFIDSSYTLSASNIVADTLITISWKNVDATSATLSAIQAQYYVKRSLS